MNGVYIRAGTASRFVCRNPPMSSMPENSGPLGWLTRSVTTLDSMARTIGARVTVPPVSSAVRFVVP
jgi:hypothetical protein